MTLKHRIFRFLQDVLSRMSSFRSSYVALESNIDRDQGRELKSILERAFEIVFPPGVTDTWNMVEDLVRDTVTHITYNLNKSSAA